MKVSYVSEFVQCLIGVMIGMIVAGGFALWLEDIEANAPFQVTEEVTEARRLVGDCQRAGGSPHIKTEWDAPANEPRVPVSWKITCY